MSDGKGRRARAAVDQNWRRTQLGFSQLFDLIAPWLFDLGTWIFGALIAFNLVILGVVLTIGPVDTAVIVATAAFALALPPNVVGFLLLRLVTDMRRIRAPDKAAEAFTSAGFQTESIPDRKQAERRMSAVTLGYTYSVMAVSFLLTLVGLTAALWHSAWWIGAAFLAMLVVSVGVMLLAASQLGGNESWRSPGSEPESQRSDQPG